MQIIVIHYLNFHINIIFRFFLKKKQIYIKNCNIPTKQLKNEKNQ